ncbi:MAG: hypothetical protein AAB339_05655, partial [Elusimicrobiota bacterium]
SPDQAQCLVLALPGQSLSPGTSNGRSGAVSISTAGTPFSASVYVTDQFFNRVPSSAPATVTMTHNDPYAAQPVTSTFSGGLMTAQMTPRSKRGAWTVPGATAKTLVSVAGAGNPGACAAGSPYSSSVGVQAANTASKKLLLRLPNEGLDPGSPTGKTAAAPQEQQAASTFTATVYAADDYFNPYEPSQGMSPDVWLELSTPYGTAGTTVTLTVGSTNYPVHILAASSNTLVNAKTENASYVQASTRVVVVPNLPTKLQLLLPGQNPLPGSYSGYSGGVSDMAAGTTYWATVNLVDDYYNLEAATSTFVSEAALVYPIVRLILSDPNIGPRGFLPVGEAALISGARQFSFIPATRTCPACSPSLPKLSAQVVDTQRSGILRAEV